MAQSGFASRFNFRKKMNSKAKQSKFADIVETTEMTEARLARELMQNEIDTKENDDDMSDEDEVDIIDIQKAQTLSVEDITKSIEK